MHRIVEVDLSDNIELDAAIANNNTVIAAYATRNDPVSFPFWSMLFDNVTIRLLGSDDFPAEAKRQAAIDLTSAASDAATADRAATAPRPSGPSARPRRRRHP